MDGRLAPYLAQNQTLHHHPRRQHHQGEYRPRWSPSPGIDARPGGYAQSAIVALVVLVTVLAVTTANVDLFSAAALSIDGGTVPWNR